MMWDIKGGERAFKIKKKKHIFQNTMFFLSFSKKPTSAVSFQKVNSIGKFSFLFFS